MSFEQELDALEADQVAGKEIMKERIAKAAEQQDEMRKLFRSKMQSQIVAPLDRVRPYMESKGHVVNYMEPEGQFVQMENTGSEGRVFWARLWLRAKDTPAPIKGKIGEQTFGLCVRFCDSKPHYLEITKTVPSIEPSQTQTTTEYNSPSHYPIQRLDQDGSFENDILTPFLRDFIKSAF